MKTFFNPVSTENLIFDESLYINSLPVNLSLKSSNLSLQETANQRLPKKKAAKPRRSKFSMRRRTKRFSDAQTIFTVLGLSDVQKTASGKLLFLVEWDVFPVHCTWEPEANLLGADVVAMKYLLLQNKNFE
jgi:hypothetical protein